jgi:hypothetical protein
MLEHALWKNNQNFVKQRPKVTTATKYTSLDSPRQICLLVGGNDAAKLPQNMKAPWWLL